MQSETRRCQNCKQDFRIEPDDFAFYEKIHVPPPTWCPECRMVRRLMFRNERTLYQRTCDLCAKNIVSVYRPGLPFPVYCPECWWSDRWDAMAYGREYDFSKPFFVQLRKLADTVPHMSLMQRNGTRVEYANFLGECKNLYLAYSTVDVENAYYSRILSRCTDIVDSLNLVDCQLCYECVDGEKNYHSSNLVRSHNCIDSHFLFDCVNCRNCVLSSNQRNQEYLIRNKKYSKEQYTTAVSALRLDSYSSREKLKKELEELKRTSLHKYAEILKSTNATGDNLINAKNADHCFDASDLENVRYSLRAVGLRECMDADFAISSELLYEYTSNAKSDHLVRFSQFAFQGVQDVHYTDLCSSSSFLFGCVGVRGKEYCILNKPYTKGEYEALVPKIVAHMNETPYVDARGRTYRYGEYLPIDLSPFAYNETLAQEYFPLTKEEALAQGYAWREPEAKTHVPTLQSVSLPDNVADIPDSITGESIECFHRGGCNDQCTEAFKIIPDELQFYRRMQLPLPRLCPNCRYYERLKQCNPLKLWHRACQCSGAASENGAYKNTLQHQHGAGKCPNKFETSYAPERKEIVYCEPCYNAEVA